MKTALIVLATAVYMFGAIMTFQRDRALGRANCWEDPRDNTATSSFGAAVLWPIYMVVAGVVVTMTSVIKPFDCKALKLERRLERAQ